jgi:type IV secretory pathway TrbD component
MGGLPRELQFVVLAGTVLAAGVLVLVLSSSPIGWVLVGVGAVLDVVAVTLLVRRASGRGRPDTPPMPGIVDRR